MPPPFIVFAVTMELLRNQTRSTHGRRVSLNLITTCFALRHILHCAKRSDYRTCGGLTDFGQGMKMEYIKKNIMILKYRHHENVWKQRMIMEYRNENAKQRFSFAHREAL